MTDKPVVNTPGEMLQQARVAAGLELDEITERTKIPPATLRHLEADEYHKISGALYVNSFLRTYAEDVGLDPVLVLDAYQRFSGEVVPAVAGQDSETVWVEEEVQIRRVGLPWGQIALAAVGGLVVILVVVWLVGQRGDGSPDPAEVAQVPTAEMAGGSGGETDAQAGAGEVLEDAADGGAGNESSGAESEGTAAPAQEEPARDAPSRTDLPRAIAGTASVPFAEGEQPVVMRLLCSEPVGAHVERDRERSYTAIRWPRTADIEPLPAAGIVAGRPYRVREGFAVYWGARQEFRLKLDRTDGVRVTLNGQERDVSWLKFDEEVVLYLPDSSGGGR